MLRGRLKKEDGTGWIKIRLNYGAYKNKKKMCTDDFTRITWSHPHHWFVVKSKS